MKKIEKVIMQHQIEMFQKIFTLQKVASDN